MARTRLIAIALGAGAAILATSLKADTQAGVDAWTSGDFSAAVRNWEVGAARGDADALFDLGQAYRLGKGVTQDLTKAEDLFGRAAALGHLEASDNYGLLLFQRGEQAQAIPYITAAAERGEPRAQYLLGIACFNGQLVPKDWIRAYALVSLANQQGLGPAATALRQMDGFVPLDQRQKAVQLAVELQARSDAERMRQLSVLDPGAIVPGPIAPAAADADPAQNEPAAHPARDLLASTLANADRHSPAIAGADLARPASAAVLPPQSAVAPKPAPPRPAVNADPVPPRATPPASASGPWRIQLGAFGHAANAEALWSRLRSRPELAGHPRITVRTGALTRLQAGGFASRTAAKSACGRLIAAGYACVATLN